MYRTISSLQPGDILVMASGGTLENLMGDNIATHAQLHGLAAVVTDSTVRDSAGIGELAMPVYARGAAVRLPLNMEPVALDVPVFCGGAQVRPGDVVIGSEDGVMVVPASRVTGRVVSTRGCRSMRTRFAAGHPVARVARRHRGGAEAQESIAAPLATNGAFHG